MRKLARQFCDTNMNFAVGLQGEAAEIQNGELSVDQKSPNYVSQEVGKKARIKMSYERWDESLELPTDVRLEKSDTGVTLSRRAVAGSKLTSVELAGFEARFSTNEQGRCELVQNAAVFQTPRGEIKRLVFDKKYCDEVREILGRHGDEKAAREKLRTCTDFLGDAQEAFNKRKAELLKENIVMSDAAAPFGDPTTSKQDQSGATLMLALMTICTPHNWTQFAAELRPQMLRGTPNSQRPTSK